LRGSRSEVNVNTLDEEKKIHATLGEAGCREYLDVEV
jgi:hypothetical protein